MGLNWRIDLKFFNWIMRFKSWGYFFRIWSGIKDFSSLLGSFHYLFILSLFHMEFVWTISYLLLQNYLWFKNESISYSIRENHFVIETIVSCSRYETANYVLIQTRIFLFNVTRQMPSVAIYVSGAFIHLCKTFCCH